MFSNFYEVYSVFSSGPSPSLSFTFCDVTNTQGSFARLLQATRILSLLRRVLSNNQEGGEPNIDGRFSHCSPVSLLTSIPVSSVTTIINAESPPPLFSSHFIRLSSRGGSFFATENFDKLDFSPPPRPPRPHIGVRQGGGVPGDEVDRRP